MPPENTLSTMTPRYTELAVSTVYVSTGCAWLTSGPPGCVDALNWMVAQSVRFAPRKLVTAISRWVAEKV